MTSIRNVLTDASQQTITLTIHDNTLPNSVMFAIDNESAVLLSAINNNPNANFGVQFHYYREAVGSSPAASGTVNITSSFSALLSDVDSSITNSDPKKIVFPMWTSSFDVSRVYRMFIEIYYETYNVVDGISTRTEHHRNSNTVKYLHTSRSIPAKPILNYTNSTGYQETAIIAIGSADSGGDAPLYQLHLIYFLVGSGENIDDGNPGNLMKFVYDVSSNDLSGNDFLLNKNLVINNLLPGMIYDFMLYTSNVYGNSEMSDPIRIVMKPSPNAVQNLSVSSYASIGISNVDGATITWSSPIKAESVSSVLLLKDTNNTYNGISYDSSLNITSYNIYRATSGGSYELVHTLSTNEDGVPDTEPSYSWVDTSFNDDHDGLSHIYKVIAVNGYGEGDDSYSSKTFTYHQKHTVIDSTFQTGYELVEGKTTVKLRWKSPTLPVNQKITAYEVVNSFNETAKISVNNDRSLGDIIHNNTGSAGSFSYDISNNIYIYTIISEAFENGTQNDFSITAFTELYNNNITPDVLASNITNISTPVTVYPYYRPTIGTTNVSIGDGSLTVSWPRILAQGQFGEATISYKIQTFLDSSANTDPVNSQTFNNPTDSEDLSIPVSPLSNNIAYKFIITAYLSVPSTDAFTDYAFVINPAKDPPSDNYDSISSVSKTIGPFVPLEPINWPQSAALNAVAGNSSIEFDWPDADLSGLARFASYELSLFTADDANVDLDNVSINFVNDEFATDSSYNAIVGLDGSGNSIIRISEKSTFSKVKITGLNNGTSYYGKVIAKSATSLTNLLLSADTTPFSTPNSPTNLSRNYITDASNNDNPGVQLAWNDPSFNGGIFNYYSIRNGETQLGTTTTTTYKLYANSHGANSLQKGNIYNDIKVITVCKNPNDASSNTIYISDSSAVFSAFVLYSKASVVNNLTATAPSGASNESTIITYSWTDPSDNGGFVISKYIVTVDDQIAAEVLGTTYTFDSVILGKSYGATVYAVTSPSVSQINAVAINDLPTSIDGVVSNRVSAYAKSRLKILSASLTGDNELTLTVQRRGGKILNYFSMFVSTNPTSGDKVINTSTITDTASTLDGSFNIVFVLSDHYQAHSSYNYRPKLDTALIVVCNEHGLDFANIVKQPNSNVVTIVDTSFIDLTLPSSS